jgi:anti-anti-sigma factor
MPLMPMTESRAEQIVRLGRLAMVSERDGDLHVVRLDGELDLANASGVDAELQRVEETDADVIVVDLSAVSFIDSSGIRVLITAARRSSRDNRLVLQSPSATVLRVLHLAGVASLLPLHG